VLASRAGPASGGRGAEISGAYRARAIVECIIACCACSRARKNMDEGLWTSIDVLEHATRFARAVAGHHTYNGSVYRGRGLDCGHAQLTPKTRDHCQREECPMR